MNLGVVPRKMDLSEQLAGGVPAHMTVGYSVSPPVDTTIPVEEQVEQILSRSCLLTASESFYQLLQPFYQQSVEGLSYADFIRGISGDSGNEAVYQLTQQLLEFARAGFQPTESQCQWQLPGRRVSLSMSLAGELVDGSLVGFQIVVEDNTQRRSQNDLIFAISQGLYSAAGPRFFSTLAEHLAATLKVDMVLISASGHGGKPKTLACNLDGESSAAHFDSADSPLAIPQRDITCYPAAVQQRFPSCQWLAGIEAESCITAPLLAGDGRQLGQLLLVSRVEFMQLDLLRSLLTIFSARAATELELQHRSREQRQRQRHQQMLIDSASSGMYIVEVEPPMPIDLPIRQQIKHLSQHARYVECNAAFGSIHGLYSAGELIGKRLMDVELHFDIAGQMRRFLADGCQLKEAEIKVSKQPAGDQIEQGEQWLSSSMTGLVKSGELWQILGNCSDISERMRHGRELAYQASHDDLTHLPNRSFFKEEVGSAIDALEPGQQLAIFLLDLDGFKEVNDTLGHLTGDILLQMIGPRLHEALLEQDVFLARLGGDEFGLLVRNSGGESELLDRAVQIISAIKTPFKVQDLDLRIGGSLGLSIYPEHGEDFTSLMRCADIAMYHAKDQSRDFEIYRPDQDHYSVRRLSLMMDLRQAIEREQLRLHYQPIIDIKSGSIRGFETLVRWQHPEHGMLPPGEFIPLIELTDIIEPLTWWVIETAIKQLLAWRQQGCEYSLSVNVSTRNIADDSFVYRMAKLLRKYKVDGHRLEIEITESTLMADPVNGRSVLMALAAMGIKFSIDDFGTGYSSLAYLKSLPINTLKIDRTFISQMMESHQDEVIVNSTIQLAHNLGMQVTAEGIESALLLGELSRLGCDKGQGFYICRPIPPVELDSWIHLYERGQNADSRYNSA